MSFTSVSVSKQLPHAIHIHSQGDIHTNSQLILKKELPLSFIEPPKHFDFPDETFSTAGNLSISVLNLPPSSPGGADFPLQSVENKDPSSHNSESDSSSSSDNSISKSTAARWIPRQAKTCSDAWRYK